MKTLKQLIKEMLSVHGAVYQDNIHGKMMRRWLKRKQNAWVDGSDVWKEYQELLGEIKNDA